MRAHLVAFTILALVVGTSCASADDLPAEAKFLETLKRDETRLVDAARRYELQQFGLMDWDKKLIEEFAHDGKTDLAQSQTAIRQGRAKNIGAVWEWVLGRYPKNGRAHNYYGEYLYDYAGDEKAGLEQWLTATQLDENIGPAHNNLGIYYFHSGEYPRGLDELQRAIRLEPNNPDFLYNMAQMYLIHFDEIEKMTKAPRDKLYKQAMEMSAKAAELSPKDFDIVQDYAVNFFAAENFGVKADWKAAVAAWRKAQPLSRTEGEKFYSLLNEARAAINGGDPKGAIAPLEAAIALRKDDPIAQQLLAKAKQGS